MTGRVWNTQYVKIINIYREENLFIKYTLICSFNIVSVCQMVCPHGYNVCIKMYKYYVSMKEKIKNI